MNVCVTGATGFVGSALVQALLATNKHDVSIVSRRLPCVLSGQVKVIHISDICMSDSLVDDLRDVDVLIHVAGRAHVMKDVEADPLAEFRRVNTQGTLDLARIASSVGVKRFIFLSSIKVNGEVTQSKTPFNEATKEAPVDNYGISKHEAELGLRAIGKTAGMEICIIRPPLVYGFEVKGNFNALTRLVSIGIPLPFGAVNNQRSFVSLDNLIDLILVCIEHENAANETFLVSDGEDISTKVLIRMLAKSHMARANLVYVSPKILRYIAKWVNFGPQMERLLGDLQVDISHTKKTLDWTPKHKMESSFAKMYQLRKKS